MKRRKERTRWERAKEDKRRGERAVVVPCRAIYRTVHFFLPFSFLLIPSTGHPSVSSPLLASFLSLLSWSTRVPTPSSFFPPFLLASFAFSSPPPPFVPVPVHSFVESPLRFFGPSRTRCWRNRWRWRTTPRYFPPSSSSSLYFVRRPFSRRGTPRNYGERKVTANEVAIQAFYHLPIPRPGPDRTTRGGARLVVRIYLAGPTLLYRNT